MTEEEGRELVGRRMFLNSSLKFNNSLSEGLRLCHDLDKVETRRCCRQLIDQLLEQPELDLS